MNYLFCVFVGFFLFVLFCFHMNMLEKGRASTGVNTVENPGRHEILLNVV